MSDRTDSNTISGVRKKNSESASKGSYQGMQNTEKLTRPSGSNRLKKIFKGRYTSKKKSEPARWLLYGAYGYTGRLIIEFALAQGLRPILSGRSIIKLRPLAEEYNLPWKVIDLDQPQALGGLLKDVELVCNVSGPFVNTTRTLIEACIESGTHYIDVSGELPSVQMAFAYEEQAKDAGVVIMPCCGISSVPTDCMVKHIVDRIGPLKSLQIAMDVNNTKSPGTLASVLEMAAYGGRVRRNHRLINEPVGRRIKNFKFSHTSKTVISVPLVDLTTAYWWSRTPNITTFIAQPLPVATLVKIIEPLNKWVLSTGKLRQLIELEIGKFVKGPTLNERKRARTYVWISALDQEDKRYEAGLETLESYSFTAASVSQVVNHLLAGGIQTKNRSLGGVYTPAQAFGADFVTNIPSTVRFGMLEPPVNPDEVPHTQDVLKVEGVGGIGAN